MKSVPLLKNHIIYLSVNELKDLGLNSENQVRNKIVSNCSTIKNPSNRKEVLVEFESLPDNYKEALLAKYGNLKEACVELQTKESIESFWRIHPEDQRHLHELNPFDTTHQDSPKKTLQLLTAAAICRWFQNTKPTQAKELGFASKTALQEAIHQHEKVKQLDCFWSANFRNFQRKFATYKKEGIEGLISKKTGNANHLKLKSEEQKETLRRLYASHKNRDLVWVADDYNQTARLNGWPEISEGTVADFLEKDSKLQAVLLRNGTSKFKADVLPTIHRNRPERPGYLWEGDGTPWELYYQYKKEGRTYYWGRKVVYVITDAYNDLPVGWAIGDSENVSLITQAWKNAILNTGMMPWQIRVDNFAKKAMGPVYERITRYFVPTGVGNARAKLIEQMFARFSATRILKEYPNWSGCNITNRTEDNQPNRDFLESEKKNFPDEEGVIAQIHESLNAFRNALIKKDGLVRFDSWLESLKETDELRLAGPKDLIDVFGIYRDEINAKYTYTFTKDGLEMIIDGESHYYMNWGDPNDPEVMGKAVEEYQELFGAKGLRVKYLPEDLNLIRVDNQRRKQVYYLEIDKKVPGCIMDMKANPDGRARLYDKLRFHRALIGEVVRKHERTIEVTNQALNRMTVDAQGALKSMFTVDGGNKQYLNEAKSYLKNLDRKITEKASADDLYDTELDEMVPSEVNTLLEEEKDLYDYD